MQLRLRLPSGKSRIILALVLAGILLAGAWVVYDHGTNTPSRLAVTKDARYYDSGKTVDIRGILVRKGSGEYSLKIPDQKMSDLDLDFSQAVTNPKSLLGKGVVKLKAKVYLLKSSTSDHLVYRFLVIS